MTRQIYCLFVPHQPKDIAASIELPHPIPPAAITGIEIFLTIFGIKHIVVVSSLPLCPPASKPSHTIASTPASLLLERNLNLKLHELQLFHVLLKFLYTFWDFQQT